MHRDTMMTKLTKNVQAILVAGMAALIMAVPMGTALAQSENAPSSTTATYGDWLVRCSQVKLPKQEGEAKTTKACEMVHVIRFTTKAGKDAKGNDVPARTQVLAHILIGKPAGTDTHRIVMQLPVGVWLRDGVEMAYADTAEGLKTAKDDRLHKASFYQCNVRSCLADAELTKAQTSGALGAKFAQMTFIDSARRKIIAQVSMNGYAGAYNAINQ